MVDENINFTVIIIRNMDKIELKSENNLELKLYVDDEFIINIHTQLGTGYRWMIENKPMDTIKLETEKVLSNTKEDKKVGQIEQQSFHFKVVKEGIENISLKYCREWEKNKKSQKMVNVNVKVKKSGEMKNG